MWLVYNKHVILLLHFVTLVTIICNIMLCFLSKFIREKEKIKLYKIKEKEIRDKIRKQLNSFKFWHK